MPVSAVRIHSSRGIATGITQHLKREAALLVDGCVVSTSQDEWQEVNADGSLLAWAAVNPQLTWALSARVLAREGLADYHPALPLSAASLPFLNGEGPLPFQFETGEGVLFYGSPSFDPVPGSLPRFTCSITLRFGRLRGSITVPSGGHEGSFGPDPVEPTPPETLRLVSLYYFRPTDGALSRIIRVVDGAPSLAVVSVYFEGLKSYPAGLWETAAGTPQSYAGHPPRPEEWTGPFGGAEPLFAGAYDHHAGAWIGAAIPGVTPEGDVLPRFVWFGTGAAITGPFVYLADPGADRPAALAGQPVAAVWHWTDGWLTAPYAGADGIPLAPAYQWPL